MEENCQISLFEAENPAYLTEQIITYLGNKRALLDFIGHAIRLVRQELNKEKIDIADVFSGSGVVSRYCKQYASSLYTNDLEAYCETINRAYLSNKADLDMPSLEKTYGEIKHILDTQPLESGFITELYSPADADHIRPGERVFYTPRNARYIDTARRLIGAAPDWQQPFLLAPLLYEASVHNNTSGVFKGFYKNSKTGIGQYGGNGRNALTRIMSDITLKLPVFSNFSCPSYVSRMDANALAKTLPQLDLAYIDPPYNQHPYGSNYFMLNLINDYQRPQEISPVSGIPVEWNKSAYNKKASAAASMRALCEDINARYLLISFNSEGFITREQMTEMLSFIGELRIFDKEYNTFRGSRNLNNRDIHVKEYLYLVKKG